ncbi:hypothetical protein [Actinophytocola sediminis]
MADDVDQWWVEVQEARQLLTSFLGGLAARARSHGAYTPLPGSTVTRRRPGSLRHLDEVIRRNRWYFGADKDMIGALLGGKLVYLTNPTLVLAVARACCAITGDELTIDDTHALIAASQRITVLVAEAHAADDRLGKAQLVRRADTGLVDPAALSGYSAEDEPTGAVLAHRRLGRRGPSASGRGRRRRGPIVVGAFIVVTVLVAVGLSTDVPSPSQVSADEVPEYRIPVMRPTAEEIALGRDQCAGRVTVVDNGNREASGSVRLTECADTIEFNVADLDRDSRCIYLEIIWSARSREKSGDACPVGHIIHQQVPKRTKEFTIELVSTYRP